MNIFILQFEHDMQILSTC